MRRIRMFDVPDHSSDFSPKRRSNAIAFLNFAISTFHLIVVAGSTAVFVAGCWTMLEALR